MFELTILTDDGHTTRDRMRYINESTCTSLEKFCDAVNQWELDKSADNVKAIFLTQSGTVIRRYEKRG